MLDIMHFEGVHLCIRIFFLGVTECTVTQNSLTTTIVVLFLKKSIET